jgi:hypothetical protein
MIVPAGATGGGHGPRGSTPPDAAWQTTPLSKPGDYGMHMVGDENLQDLHPSFVQPPHALKNVRLSLGFFLVFGIISLIFYLVAAPSRYWREHTRAGVNTGTTLFAHYGLLEVCYSSVGLESKCVDIASDCSFSVGTATLELDDCTSFTVVRVFHMLSGFFVAGGLVVAVASNYFFDKTRPYYHYIAAVGVCLLGAFCEMVAMSVFAADAASTASLKWGFGMAVLSFVAALIAPLVLLAQVVWERCC